MTMTGTIRAQETMRFPRKVTDRKRRILMVCVARLGMEKISIKSRAQLDETWRQGRELGGRREEGETVQKPR